MEKKFMVAVLVVALVAVQGILGTSAYSQEAPSKEPAKNR